MAKETLESLLRARAADPRALNGTLIIRPGLTRIVFGEVGKHRRFSVTVKGDEFHMFNDPRPAVLEVEQAAADKGLVGDAGPELADLPSEDEAASDETPSDDDEEDALAAAKAEADELGIQYGGNIGLATLQERIAQHKAEQA